MRHYPRTRIVAVATLILTVSAMGFATHMGPRLTSRSPTSFAAVVPVAATCSSGPAAGRTTRAQPVRVRAGADAAAFVENLIRTNPRFARAQQMAEREFGYPAIAYTVHEVGAPPRPSSSWQKLIQWLAPSLSAQYYDADDGSGYVVFSTYYDDYSSYWEGNVYSQAYDGVVWETIDSGIYTPSNSVEWTGNADGTAERPQARVLDRGNGLLAFFFPTVGAQGPTPCDCAPARWSTCALQNALADSWSFCASAAGYCSLRVVIYWECLGAGCVPRFAGSLIAQLWKIRNGCG